VSEVEQGVYVPVRPSFRFSVTGGDEKRLSWQAPYSGRTDVFYAVLRSATSYPDPTNPEDRTVENGVSCIEHSGNSSVDCRLFMRKIGVTHGRAFRDRPPPGRWTYRVALSANWVNDPNLGDIVMVSPPVNVVVRR
jgi:hypothetical protein